MNKNDDMLMRDIENILKDYFNFNQIVEIMNSIDVRIHGEKNQLERSNASCHVGINYSAAAIHRGLINGIISFAAKKISQVELIKFLAELSRMTIQHGEFNIAAEINEEIIRRASGSDDLSIPTAQAYLDLAKIAQCQAYWSESISFVNKSYEIFKTKKDSYGFAKCENMLGTLFGEQGEVLKAKNHFLAALNYLDDSDDMSFIAMLENNLGILESIQGNYGNAKWNIKNALQKWLGLKEYLKAARAHHNLGMIYTKLKNYHAALEEFDSSISISNQNNYVSNSAIGYISKAYVYILLKNFDLAEAFSSKALELAYYINDTLTIAEVYKIKGMMQEEIENLELSVEMLENSLRLSDDFDNQLNKAETNWALNKLYRKRNNFHEADEKKIAALGYYDLIKAQAYIKDLLEAQTN